MRTKRYIKYKDRVYRWFSNEEEAAIAKEFEVEISGTAKELTDEPRHKLQDLPGHYFVLLKYKEYTLPTILNRAKMQPNTNTAISMLWELFHEIGDPVMKSLFNMEVIRLALRYSKEAIERARNKPDSK